MSEQQPLTLETMEVGVREDGTVEDCFIETFYQPLEYVQQDQRGFLCVVSDGPGYNVETRVPFSGLIALGWTPPAIAAATGREGE